MKSLKSLLVFFQGCVFMMFFLLLTLVTVTVRYKLRGGAAALGIGRRWEPSFSKEKKAEPKYFDRAGSGKGAR